MRWSRVELDAIVDGFRIPPLLPLLTSADSDARRLAVKTCAEFFGAPIIGYRPALRLVVDNDAP